MSKFVMLLNHGIHQGDRSDELLERYRCIVNRLRTASSGPPKKQQKGKTGPKVNLPDRLDIRFFIHAMDETLGCA